MQVFRFWAPAASPSNPGSTQVLGRGGRRLRQRKQAYCTRALVYRSQPGALEAGLTLSGYIPWSLPLGSLGLVNLVGEKGKLRVLTSQEEMSRLWFSFCRARTHAVITRQWLEKEKRSKKTGELPEGSHSGEKRQRLTGLRG